MYRWIAVFLVLLVMSAVGITTQAMGEEILEEDQENVIIPGEQNTDLAASYIHQELYRKKYSSLFRIPRLIGNLLTGVDRVIYDGLKQEIVSVAAGERTSTAFIFPVETLYSVHSFTAEDLGVEALSTDGTLTQEAESAAKGMVKSYHSSTIISALQADCPYELYWYNKAAGGGCKVSSALQCVLSQDGQTVTVNGYIKFSMAVAEEYATDVYEVDPSYGQSVRAAAENAWRIVEQYKTYSNYDRLLAYKNAICDLVSYNYDAAGGDVPYGNPWQLVWVFDGNEDTNVVCEGYAKAFQYLNDLSSSSVTVISPQGTINGGSHMWNIVKMENGRNYLVDVTNCDSGMAGYPDKLFLVGYASGSVSDGYQTEIGLTYAYRASTVFPQEDLTLSSWNYLDAWPEVPICSFSATKGFTGYQLAVRLNEDADEIILQENGAAFACVERDALIPLEEAGTQQFTIAAVRDGLTSDYGETFSLEVMVPPSSALRIPEGVLSIEEEAFRGIQAAAVVVPSSVRQICDYAFADNESLALAETGSAAVSATAFDHCPHVVLCIEDMKKGFQGETEFLVLRNGTDDSTAAAEESAD